MDLTCATNFFLPGSILATPRLAQVPLGICDLLELPRRPLLIALVFVGVVFSDKFLELLLDPRALDLLAMFLKVDRELKDLNVVPRRGFPVGKTSVLVVEVVLLPPIPVLLQSER